MTSEGETLILKKNSTEFCSDKKMVNKDIRGFLQTTKFYKSKNAANPFLPKKRNTEGKASIHPEGTTIKKQGNTTPKQIATRKIHANELHTKIGNSREYRMYKTTKHLQ